MNSQYFTIELDSPISDGQVSIVFDQYSCQGIEDISLNEEEVDAFLGDESFCGGNLSQDLIERLEEEFSDSSGKRLFFYDKKSAEDCAEYLKLSLNLESNVKIHQNEDWNETWKKSYEKISLLNGEINIVPSWDKEEGDYSSLFIYPGQGFGTGTHPTTQQCLEIFHKENLSPKKVLDFGCGSGILGIFVQKKDPSVQAYYFDIDQEAIENTLVNLELNSIKSNFYAKSSKDGKYHKSFELVFANILAGVLIEESNYLESVCSKYLIISGILEEQVEEVLSYFPHFQPVRLSTREQWTAIFLQRNESAFS
jgi:ribosomal protein L11 methyltransferase